MLVVVIRENEDLIDIFPVFKAEVKLSLPDETV